LADFPEIGRSCNNLQPKLKSFPMENYLIFYRPTASGIEIVRIVSGYRDLEVLFSSEENI
jgi:toxin ParE1/3/4